jgi:FkbM family methyltransferase
MISSVLHQPAVRSLVRRVGLTSIGNRLIRSIYGDPSEEPQLTKALLDAVFPGDCVWDVGANVGHYTRLLAERVGQSGCVVAFEPFSPAFRQLAANTSRFPQVKSLQLALGAYEQDLHIDPVAHSPGFSLIGNGAENGEAVHVTTGRKTILEGCPRPNILKVDVEGFEEDVLWGMREELANPVCRTVFIEVHFSLLERRGFQRAPGRLISLLEDFGFRTRWLDQSHLSGSRARK